MKNVYLLQPQFAIKFNGKVNYWIPYSVGTIWSYCAQFDHIRDNFALKDLIFKRDTADELVERLENPVVCGFSCYVWNRNYCLELAEKVKARWPDCAIIFGGPEVDVTMSMNDFIDCVVIGEGEENFKIILENILYSKKLEPVMSANKRLADLSGIPSPYTTGVFDDIIRNNPDAVWAVTLETNRGCPYSCTFCDWGSLTYSKVRKFELDKVFGEIDWVEKIGLVSNINLADANFGMFKERDLTIAKKLGEVSRASKTLELVTVQGAKQSNEVAFQIGQLLGNAHTGVTVSMQSMNEDTLVAIKRKNLKTNDIKELLSLAETYEVPVYTEMILGLPLETLATWKKGFTDLLELGHHGTLDMYVTQLIRNSELSSPDSRFKYKIKSRKLINLNSYRCEDSKFPLEESEVVIETSTMSTEDLVAGYVYGWFIIQFHSIGRTQILSKYLRYTQDVSYEDFYNTLFDEMSKDSVFIDLVAEITDIIRDYYAGIVRDVNSIYLLYLTNSSKIMDNQQHLLGIATNAIKKHWAVPGWVLNLHMSFLFNKEHSYPIIIDGDYNLSSKVQESVTYVVTPQIDEDTNLSASAVRRRGFLKNKLTIKHAQTN